MMLLCGTFVTLVFVTSSALILASATPLNFVLKDLIVALNVQNSEYSFGVLSVSSDMETSALLLLMKDAEVRNLRPLVTKLATNDSLQLLKQRVLLLVLPETEVLSNDSLLIVENVIQEASRRAVFVLNTRNQIPEKWFHHLSTGINMKLFIVINHKRNLQIVELYRFPGMGDLHRKVIAEKSAENSWTFNLHLDDIWSRRTNMEGYPARITTVTKLYRDVQKMDTLKYHIYFAAVWWLLDSALNISTTIIDFNMTEIGVYVNGSWTGFMGVLQNGRADVFVTSLALALERMSVIDISEEVFTAKFRMWVRRSVARPSLRSLVGVFHGQLWAALAASTLCLPLVLHAAARGAHSIGLEHRTPSVSSCFIALVGCFCNQGWSESPPQSRPLRLVALLSLVLGLVAAAAYSSSLMARLTAPRAYLPFTSLDEMVDVGTHTLLVYEQTLPHRVIASARNGTLGRVARFMASRPDGVHSDDLTAMRRMCAGDGSMLDIREFLGNEPPCPFTAATPTIICVHGGLAIRKGYPPLGAIDSCLRKAREGGLINKLKRTYFPAGNSEADSAHNFGAIELEHVIAVFSFFGLCVAISVFVLLTEQIASKGLHKTWVWISGKRFILPLRRDFIQ